MFPAFDALQVAIRITRGGTPPPTDYLHYWSMDNVSGSTVFDDGTGTSADLAKTNITHPTGVDGDASECTTLTASPLLYGRVQDIVDSHDAFTVSYWLKRDGSSWTLSTGSIAVPITMMADFTNRGWYMTNGNDANDGGVLLMGDWTSYQIAGYTGLDTQGDGVWNHICFTYTQSVYTAGDGVCKTYFNGQLSSTYTGLGLSYHQSPLGAIYMLGRGRTNESATNMQIDDVKYYDYVLTAAEADSLYQEFAP